MSKILSLLRRLSVKPKEAEEKRYPKSNFKNQHLKNCVSLVDRVELLKLLPQNSVIAEIGVFKGDFTSKILEICKPQKLVLIDIWGSNRYNENHYQYIQEKFQKEISSGQVEVIRKLSFDGISSIADGYFDWVYLDTDHKLDTTRKELKLLKPKIKSGGIISGHDYVQGSWVNGVRYGVIESVREFCLENNWELKYITHELDNHPSFAIKEI